MKLPAALALLLALAAIHADEVVMPPALFIPPVSTATDIQGE